MILRLAILAEILVCSAIFWALGCAMAARPKRSLNKFFIRAGWSILAIAPWAVGAIIIFFLKFKIDITGLARVIYAFIGAFCVIAAGISVTGRSKLSDSQQPRAANWKMPRLCIFLVVTLFAIALNTAVCNRIIWKELVAKAETIIAEANNLLPLEFDPAGNAVSYYLKANDMLLINTPDWQDAATQWRTHDNANFETDRESIELFLTANSEAIKLIRQGCEKTHCNWGYSAETIMDHLNDDSYGISKNQARLMSLSCRVAISQKNYQQAASDISCISKISEHRTSLPTMISLLVATAEQFFVFQDTQLLLESCPINSKKLYTLEINPNFSLKSVLSDSMIMEKMLGASVLTENKPLLTSANLELCSPYIIAMGPEDFDSYFEMLDTYAELAKQPYSKSIGQIDSISPDTKPAKGLMSVILLPSMQKAALLVTTAESIHQTMVLTCAISRYSIDEGKLPDNLNQLSPKYLESLPVDPFTGEQFRMIRDGNTLTVYCVGPNMADDNGAAYDPVDKSGDISLKMRFE